jgi:hypothetical protein
MENHMPPSAIVDMPGQTDVRHYVDWPAIFAGVAIASAIATVLFTFGAALGLTMVSPYSGRGASSATYLSLMGIWALVVTVLSFAAGGYVAGRLRKRSHDAADAEVEVRDGAHGLTVWGVGVVAGALLVAVGVTGAIGGAIHAAAPGGQDRHNGITQFTVDALFRPANGEKRATAATEDRDRAEAVRLLTYGTTKGELEADDRAYLARLVSDETGLSRADAEQRVDEVLARAKHAADVTRKAGIVAGFLMAAALAVSAAAAAWAAAAAGHHRDRATGPSTFWRWRRA